MTSPRQRYRDDVRAQIKAIADTQLAELGPGGLSLSAIAREVGVSGPALYRYFASRDALLMELVIDAYGDLADAIATAQTKNGGDPLSSYLHAYRQWAQVQPHRYRLLFSPPVPGFDPNHAEVVRVASRSMSLLVDTINPEIHSSPIDDIAAPLASQFTSWASAANITATAPQLVRATAIWAHIHGFVSLEISGNLSAMASSLDVLFDVEITAAQSIARYTRT